MRLDDLVAEWLNKAREDIRSARYLAGMNPMPVEIIGFHAQQGMEKCLKAILVSSGMEPPKAHV